MIKDSAEHEAYKQSVLGRFEDEATAKFEALIPTITDNIPAALDALAHLQAVRGLTKCEERIMVGLLQLEMYKFAASHFNREALKDHITQVQV